MANVEYTTQQPYGGGPTVTAQLGPIPQRITCPHCHAEITTTVTPENSTKTHLMALLLFVFGCWCCCCIPYMKDSCRNQNHYCPNCHAFLGTYAT